MAAPTYQSHTTNSGGGTAGAATVSVPGGYQLDDVLVPFIISHSEVGAPSGAWTHIGDQLSGTVLNISAWWKRALAAGSEPASYSFGFDGPSAYVQGCFLVRGVDPSIDPIIDFVGIDSLDNPGIDSAVDEWLLLGAFGVESSSGSGGFTPPVGMTERWDLRRLQFVLEGVHETLLTDGPTGHRQAAFSSSITRSVSMLVGITAEPAMTAQEGWGIPL